MDATEEWRPIPGWEGKYECSSLGRVRSLARTIVRSDGKPLSLAGRALTTSPNGRGYPRVSLCDAGSSSWFAVHSLIAMAFLPPPRRGTGAGRDDYCVNHKNGDKADNRAVNLEYVTNRANLAHAYGTGLLDNRGTKNGRSKLTEEEVREMRSLYSAGWTQAMLGERFGIDQAGVSRVILRKSYADVA